MKSMALTWIALTALAMAPAAASDAPTTRLEALDWLTGCWAGDDEETHFEECWLHGAGGMMLGLNRTVSSRGTQFEFLRIVADADGLRYLASPGGKTPVAFPLTEFGDTMAVFTNPDHDFPQRITYRLAGDTLTARVEADQAGEWQGFEIVWTRSSLGD